MIETAKSCFCVGPQNGQPVCPCRMRYLKIVNGRYVETIDRGPAPKKRTTGIGDPITDYTDYLYGSGR